LNALWVDFLLVKADTRFVGVHCRQPAQQRPTCRSEVRTPDSAADRQHVRRSHMAAVVAAAAVAAVAGGAGACP